MKKPRWPHAIALLTLPSAAVATAPYLGAAHWVVDLLACFVVQACIALMAATAILAIGRKWTLACATATFAIIAASATVPDWLRKPSASRRSDDSPELRLVAINLLKSNDAGHSQAIQVIQEAAADLVWFAEYTPTWQRVLGEALPELPYRLERLDLGSFGVAMYSRYPFELKELVPGGHVWSPFGRAVIRTPHGPIGVLGVHPPPPQLNRISVSERDRGLAAIPPLLNRLPKRRIVLGDFNATPWNDAFQEMRRRSGLGVGSTAWWLPSWPDPLPACLRVPLDHVLVSGDLSVTRAALGPAFGSDHRPLTATVRVGG